MKTKIRIAINLILYVCLFYGLFHYDSYNAKHFETTINDYMDDNKTSMVRIEDVTRFKWDRMYTFMPYTAEDDINRIIGLKWAGPFFRGAPMTEGQTLVLFMYKGKVSHYFYIRGYLKECTGGCGNNIEVSL